MPSTAPRRIAAFVGLHLAVCLAAVESLSPRWHASRRVLLLHVALLAGLAGLIAAAIGRWIAPGGRAGTRAGRIAIAAGATVCASALGLLYLLDFIGNRAWGGNVTYQIVRQYAALAAPNRSPFFISRWVYASLAGAILLLFAAYWRASPLLIETAQLAARISRSAWTAMLVSYVTGLALLVRSASRADLLVREPLIGFFAVNDSIFDFNQYSLDRALPRRELEVRRSYPRGLPFDRRNVVLITVDSLRADHMEVYGYERPTTPFLTSLWRQGRLKRVDFAVSTCAESNCGILSILTSKRFRHLAPESFSLMNLLQDQGYRIFQILSGNHDWQGLRRAYGGGQTLYFDGASFRQYGVNDDRGLFEGLDRVPPFASTPAFFHFHLMSVHLAGDKQERYRRFQPWKATHWGELLATTRDRQAAANNYDNGVLQADAVLRDLFDALRRKGYLARSLIVIVADHGEGLGEHGADVFGHVRWLYQEFIRIPLLIYDDAEGVSYANLRRASQIDVAPTIVDRLGLPLPSTWEGRSLLQPSMDQYTYHQTARWDPCYAVLSRYQPADYKYLRCEQGADEELYDLDADPGERHNLIAAAPPGLVQQFRNALAAHLTDTLEGTAPDTSPCARQGCAGR